MPITIELMLIDDPLDPLISNFTNYQGGVALPANAFTNAETSTTWQIQNVQAKCDLVTLDSSLNESYIKLLEEGKKLTLNYHTFMSQYQTIIDQTDISINITRSLIRLKSVFVSLWEKLRITSKSLDVVPQELEWFLLSSSAWDY